MLDLSGLTAHTIGKAHGWDCPRCARPTLTLYGGELSAVPICRACLDAERPARETNRRKGAR